MNFLKQVEGIINNNCISKNIFQMNEDYYGAP